MWRDKKNITARTGLLRCMRKLMRMRREEMLARDRDDELKPPAQFMEALTGWARAESD
jgi:hypothetical protein